MLYDFKCPTCNTIQEVYSAWKDYDPNKFICTCGTQMERIFTPIAIKCTDYSIYNTTIGPNAKDKLKQGKVVPIEDTKFLRHKPKNMDLNKEEVAHITRILGD